MRRFIALLLGLALVLASTAYAAPITSVTMMSETTGTSSAWNVSSWPVKTVIVGHVSSGSFANYSGTFKLQCAANSAGPWTTCKDVGSNLVTKTHDGDGAVGTGALYNLRDASTWVRAVFTPLSAATKNKVTVILQYAKELVGQ